MNIIKMLYFNRSDVSEGLMLVKLIVILVMLVIFDTIVVS